MIDEKPLPSTTSLPGSGDRRFIGGPGVGAYVAVPFVWAGFLFLIFTLVKP